MKTRKQRFGGWEQPATPNCSALLCFQVSAFLTQRNRREPKMATATTTRGGGSILCSHHELFNRHCFLSLHPPRPLLHKPRSSKPTSTFLVHSKPIGPRLKLATPRAADSSSVPATCDKAIVTDDQFSLAKVGLKFTAFSDYCFVHSC